MALGDTEKNVRLEALRQIVNMQAMFALLIHRAKEDNEDVVSLLKRYKERILFMSRDSQPIVICAAIKLIDLMRGKN